MRARVFTAFIPDALKWKLRKWVWMRLNPSWTLKSGLVIRVLNYNDWMIYNDIFVDGEYDVPLKHLLEKSTPATARVLDLGANVGFFTLRLADAFLQGGRSGFEALMIEGSPSTYAELRQRLSANNDLLSGKIRALHGLAGERSGEALIAESPSHGENTILSGSGGRTKRVPFIDLDQLVADWERIDLLKCDIEGAEELFLRNYPSLCEKTDSAVFEFHHQQCDIPECRRLLGKAGLTNHSLLREFGRYSVEFFWRD